MSISTTSGRSRRTTLTASAPSVASPTTQMHGSDSRIMRNPARTSAWSSAMTALTNGLKHARGAPTEVVLRYTEDSLSIDVLNSSPPLGSSEEAQVNGSGRGLVGIQQRVALYGGHVETRAHPSGSFALHARLPVPSS